MTTLTAKGNNGYTHPVNKFRIICDNFLCGDFLLLKTQSTMTFGFHNWSA